MSSNSAWFAKDDNDEGKLWLGLPHMRYMEASAQLPEVKFHDKDPITVALVHHPSEWLHDQDRHASDSRPNSVDYLARRCQVLLTGHTHGEVRRADRIAEGAWRFTGGAAYAGASHFNSFRLLQITLDQIVYRSFEFDPRSAQNKWRSSDAVGLPIITEIAAQKSSMLEASKIVFDIRTDLRSDAKRTLERKSRLLRPFGVLPHDTPQMALSSGECSA